jgi:hypothetical protein
MEWKIQAYHKNSKKYSVSGPTEKMQKLLEVQFYTRGERLKRNNYETTTMQTLNWQLIRITIDTRYVFIYDKLALSAYHP